MEEDIEDIKNIRAELSSDQKPDKELLEKVNNFNYNDCCVVENSLYKIDYKDGRLKAKFKPLYKTIVYSLTLLMFPILFFFNGSRFGDIGILVSILYLLLSGFIGMIGFITITKEKRDGVIFLHDSVKKDNLYKYYKEPPKDRLSKLEEEIRNKIVDDMIMD